MNTYSQDLTAGMQCIAAFEEAFGDYETVLAVKKRISVPFVGKYTHSMACAVINPLNAKYAVSQKRVGVEDLKLPGYGNEGFGDLLRSIGEAIMSAIKKFFSWVGSMFGIGSGGSSGGGSGGGGSGGGGGGGGGARKAAHAAKEQKFEKTKEEVSKQKPKPQKSKSGMSEEEIKEILKASDEIQQEISRNLRLFPFTSNKVNLAIIIDHLKDSKEQLDTMVKVFDFYGSTITNTLESTNVNIEDIKNQANGIMDKMIDGLKKFDQAGKEISAGMKTDVGVKITDSETLALIKNQGGDVGSASIVLRPPGSRDIISYYKPEEDPEKPSIICFEYAERSPAPENIKYIYNANGILLQYCETIEEYSEYVDNFDKHIKKYTKVLIDALHKTDVVVETLIKEKPTDATSDETKALRIVQKLIAVSFRLAHSFGIWTESAESIWSKHVDLMYLLRKDQDLPIIEI